MQKLRKNKKGSIQDIILMGSILLFFGLIVLFGFKIGAEFNSEIQSHTEFDQQVRDVSTETIDHYTGVVDSTFLFFVIGMGLVILTLAALVRIHPIFIPFFFIALIFIIFFSGILSNIYQETAENTVIAAEAAQLTFITKILTALPLIIGIFGILLMIIQYKRWQISQE